MLNRADSVRTGLTAALFTRDGKEVAAPDGRAGLHVRDRAGRIVRAAFPADHLAFQMGEAMQARSHERLCRNCGVCLHIMALRLRRAGSMNGLQSRP